MALDRFTVSPSTNGMPTISAPAVEDYGSRQLVQTGQAITQAGGVAADIFTDHLNEVNKTRVTEALATATERRLERTHGENGFTRLKGKDALDLGDGKSAVDVYGDEFENDLQTIEQGLGNKAQQKMFRERADVFKLQFREDLTKYTQAESINYRKSVATGAVETLNRQIAFARGDSAVIDEALGGIEVQARELGSLTGVAEEQMPGLIRELTSQALSVNVKNLLDEGDFETAQSLYNTYRDKFTIEASSAVEGAIADEQNYQVGTGIGDAVFGDTAAAVSAVTPTEVGYPVYGKFQKTGKFGENRGTHNHAGADLAMPRGTEVHAGAAGVARVKNDPDGYGLYVDLDVGGGTVLRMAHLDKTDIKDGERVTKGQVIARSGSSGRSTGPHLHYEVRVNGKAVDPDAWHAGKPKAGGGEVSAAASFDDGIAKIMALGLPREQEEHAIRRFELRHNARKKAESEREQQAVDDAMRYMVDNGVGYDGLPRNLARNIPGSSLSGVISFGKALTAPEPVDEEQGMVAWGKAMEGIASGRITKVDQLLPIVPQLTQGQYSSLVTKVTGEGKKGYQPGDHASTKAALSWMKTDLAAAGIDEKDDPEEYGKFRGALLQRIQLAEAAKGKQLTDDEAAKIGASLLAETNVDRPGWFTGNRRGYELDNGQLPAAAIPLDVRNAITRSLIARGVQPTSANIAREYRAYERGGK